jgi:CHAD domain-containing protein
VTAANKWKVEWDEKAGAAANARRELPRSVAAFFAEGRAALAANVRPERLHPLRVSGKRLRYSLELFEPCYGPGLQERLDALKQVQDALGDLQDAVASRRTIRKLMRPSRQRATLERLASTRAAEKAKAFREHWEKVFDARGRERWWTGYLAREAKDPDV